jgi:SatD family (SatD)
VFHSKCVNTENKLAGAHPKRRITKTSKSKTLMQAPSRGRYPAATYPKSSKPLGWGPNDIDACIFTYNSLLLHIKMQTKNTTYGVLVADVVESRSYSHLRSSLNEKLRIASLAQLDDKLIRVPYAVTAGDEFQTIATRVDSIPKLILDLRRRLQPLPLRIGIGIGAIQGPIRPPVNRIAGQAFEFARAAIHQIKETRKYPTLTAFRSYNSELDEIANLVYGLHDTLLLQITAKQWKTIATYLIKNRVDYTAKALSVDISTASRNLKRGYFWQIEHTTVVMESILGRTFR